MIRLPWLDAAGLDFPPVEQALDDPNGLLAAGGDLSPRRLLRAYRCGIFPWYETGQPILWWSPDPRSIFIPERVHVSRSLRKVLRRGDFGVTTDCRFAEVVSQCAAPRRDAVGTWITDEMARAYQQLHELGYAHSVEVWQEGQLVGGLYGVAIGRAFFGESMFSRVSNASKVALVRLADYLQQRDFGLIDCQVDSGHLRSMGAEPMPRAVFQQLLLNYTDWAREASFAPGRWDFETGSSDQLP